MSGAQWPEHTLPDGWTPGKNGPCPVTGEGKDRAWFDPIKGAIGCRGCDMKDPAVFKSHLEAFGVPVYSWRNVSTGERVTQARKKWPYQAKVKQCIYTPNGAIGKPGLFVVEGAKDAEALHRAGWPVAAIQSSAGRVDPAVVAEIGKSPSVILWPDNDADTAKGLRCMNALGVSLSSLGVSVSMVDPDALELPKDGAGAADWRMLTDDPIAARDAIDESIREFTPRTKSLKPEYLKRFCDIAEAPDVPPCLIPGFAFERRLTMFHAPSGAGKSHILYQGIAAALLRKEFLGSECGTVTPMLVIGEMVEEDNRRYLQRHGVSEALMRDCWYMPSMKLSEVKDAADFVKPRLILVDTATSLARVAGLSINTDVEVRRMADQFREIGCATVFLHHDRRLPASDKGEKKYDGMRGSDDFRAVSDLVVTLDRDGSGGSLQYEKSRFPISDVRVGFQDGAYFAINDGNTAEQHSTIELRSRIASIVKFNPQGISRVKVARQLCEDDALPGKESSIRNAIRPYINALMQDGTLVEAGGRLLHRDHAPPPESLIP